jgi:hypothetical protein
MADKKNNKIKKVVKSSSDQTESQEDFLKRIKSVMDQSAEKAKKEPMAFTAKYEEAKASGAKMAATFKELEECKKIEEEFKINPPILTTKHIGGICVERYYDAKIQPKVDLLKKHLIPFLSSTHDTSIFPIVFNTFGKAYIKRSTKKVTLPESSAELPFIIKDGDIIGTEDKSFVLELKDETQDEENNYWHVFIFPNSELKISIQEKVSHPAPGYMVPSQVPDAIKRESTSTVYAHKIEGIELLSGLFNIKVKKAGRDVNNIVKFTSGFPEVEFNQAGGLMNEMVKDAMEKAGASLGAAYLSKVAGALGELKSSASKKGSDEINSFIELNKDGSVVIFATTSRVALKGSSKMTKKISTAQYNPVKITAMRGTLYETDGSKSPDQRVEAIMKMWMPISSYIASLQMKNEYEYKLSGKSLSVEKAQKMAEYAKTLGDKDMENAAKIILKREENNEAMIKGIAAREADKEGQKKEALEQLKFAEESGEKELIEVAKIQLKNIDAPTIGYDATTGAEKALEMAESNLQKFRPLIEISLPSYNHPSSGDVV